MIKRREKRDNFLVERKFRGGRKASHFLRREGYSAEGGKGGSNIMCI